MDKSSSVSLGNNSVISQADYATLWFTSFKPRTADHWDTFHDSELISMKPGEI
jgi:hypothetical protein